jgi:hypothetical protein
MPQRPSWRIALSAALTVAGRARCPAHAQQTATPQNSTLDAPMFYQLLIGELELSQGQPGNAYEVILDAARRTRDEQLFRRAVDIALQARSGDQAWPPAAPGARRRPSRPIHCACSCRSCRR